MRAGYSGSTKGRGCKVLPLSVESIFWQCWLISSAQFWSVNWMSPELRLHLALFWSLVVTYCRKCKVLAGIMSFISKLFNCEKSQNHQNQFMGIDKGKNPTDTRIIYQEECLVQYCINLCSYSVGSVSIITIKGRASRWERRNFLFSRLLVPSFLIFSSITHFVLNNFIK